MAGVRGPSSSQRHEEQDLDDAAEETANPGGRCSGRGRGTPVLALDGEFFSVNKYSARSSKTTQSTR